MDLRAFFTPAAIAAQWNETASNRVPYLGAGLFPTKKKAGLDLSWLKGSKGLPVSLMPSAFDAKATFRDRIGFSKIETEMPFFREGFKIKEKDRQELLRVADSNDPYARAVIERVFDDANNLIDGANVVPERMIMQLLFPQDGNAGIAIRANGVEYVYNYDPQGTWKARNYIELSGADLWSASATADPFAVFKTAKDTIRSGTGTELTIAVMNTATFNMMAKTEAVKKRYLTTSGLTLGYLTDDEVKNVVSGTSRVQIAIYDKQYKDESGIAHAFVPDGYVAMIPAGDLGGTWYGTTPEEADLIASPTAEVELVNTGVAITRIIEEHPVNTNIFASEIVLPSYERMDEVAVIKVAGESAAALAAEEPVQKTRAAAK